MPPYDRALKPPGPVIDVVVVHPAGETRRTEVRAKLDSGADITVVPARVVARLHIMPHGLVWIRGYDGALLRRPVYYVRLIIAGVDLPSVRCVAADRHDALLGGNVLNRFIVTLHGKGLTFDLRDP